jgi:hypothetical protein
MTLLFFLFQSSWGQWICAWAPSFTVISNILPCFLVIFCLFNGVVVPYTQLNVFWKYWVCLISQPLTPEALFIDHPPALLA